MVGDTHKAGPSWNVGLILSDMALKGWSQAELARRAGVSQNTVSLFARGIFQSNKTGAKLAKALRRSPSRYLVAAEGAAA